jgi:hypothetical protein
MKTKSKILEVRGNSENTLAVLLETTDTPSGILVDKKELGSSSEYLQKGRSVVVETKGPLRIAGSKFVALYAPGQEEPFYRNK